MAGDHAWLAAATQARDRVQVRSSATDCSPERFLMPRSLEQMAEGRSCCCCEHEPRGPHLQGCTAIMVLGRTPGKLRA